jgi:hypothetical protein
MVRYDMKKVPAELLVERVVGRRMDPDTGAIYHLKYKPPPPEIVPRLVQRSDDTEEKVRRWWLLQLLHQMAAHTACCSRHHITTAGSGSRHCPRLVAWLRAAAGDCCADDVISRCCKCPMHGHFQEAEGDRH